MSRKHPTGCRVERISRSEQIAGVETLEVRTLLSAVNAFAPITGEGNPVEGLQDEFLDDYMRLRIATNLVTSGDVNGDGKTDLLVTNLKQSESTPYARRTRYFENTGTATDPAFTLRSGSESPFNFLNDAAYQFSALTLQDLDQNGTLDLVVSMLDGTYRYYKNTGTETAPAFTQLTGSNNPFNGIHVGIYNYYVGWNISSPTFGDLNNDGLPDMIAGVYGADSLKYFENTGTHSAPSFTERTGAQNPVAGIPNTKIYTPALRDLDGDGLLDLFGGAFDTLFRYYRNTGSATSPTFTEVTGLESPLYGVDTDIFRDQSFSSRDALTVNDFTNDGIPDLVTGSYRGLIYFRGGLTNPPTLDPGGDPLLVTTEDVVNNEGTLISDLIASMSPGGGITDPDVGAMQGIAIRGANDTYGKWQFSTNGGTSWRDLGGVSDSSARLLLADSVTRIRFVPKTNFSGDLPIALSIRAWDGTQGFNGERLAIIVDNQYARCVSTQTEIVALYVTPVNDSPVIHYGYGAVTYSIPQNISPKDNQGILVSEMLQFFNNSQTYIDPDLNDLQGIVITGANQTSGFWQFSTDNGANWTNFGLTTVTPNLLLASDADTRFRFVPNGFFTGKTGISFSPWDQTEGTNGQRLKVTQYGSGSSYGIGGVSLLMNVDPIAPGAGVGVYRNGTFYLDANGNRSWEASAGGDALFGFAAASDIPVTGDWNGDGITDVGVFRNGSFFLDANGNRNWDGMEGGDAVFGFAAATDIPITGDWNGDGKTEVGVVRNGRFYLDSNGNRRYDSSDASFGFGALNDTPITGDWNGDGKTDVGVYRAGKFYLDANGNQKWDGPFPNDAVFGFAAATDLPVTGDWNNDGITDVGVYRAGKFYLDTNGNRKYDGAADGTVNFGGAKDLPLGGKWWPDNFFSSPLPSEQSDIQAGVWPSPGDQSSSDSSTTILSSFSPSVSPVDVL
ncbi:MAG: VCBS repeat-containing protein, partial [Planctomycetaceae bacterium]|nr:VCBS repeat-containing protein [Planctomycetaceae bacterium]